MGKLAQRFLDPAKSGVYRVADADVPRRAAGEARLALLEAALGDASGRDELLRRLGVAFGFPDWYGENWDALEDCLGDLTWQPAKGYVLLLHGADAFAARHARDFGVLADVLGTCAAGWRARGVPFFALCIDPRGGLALPALYDDTR